MPTGQRMPLVSTITVGRLPDSGLSLNDANVSRRHAEFRVQGTSFAIVDLGSTNGTKVNGARIDGEHLLRDGDIISFGGTHIRFEAS